MASRKQLSYSLGLVAFSLALCCCQSKPAARVDSSRIVAIGDLHGDLDVTRRVLRLVGAIDAANNWIGGELAIVQVGDLIDRGPDDRAVIDFMHELKTKASTAGGSVHLLNGNHEAMNVQFDFRYVHPAAWQPFADIEHDSNDDQLLTYAEEKRGRVAAFRPGGPYARILAENETVLILGETVFVHGGLRPEHVEYGIEKINKDLSAWIRGETEEPTELTGADPNDDDIDEDGPLWDRNYSYGTSSYDCEVLEKTLSLLSAKRMVVGHTYQLNGIKSECDGMVWQVDTGMSAHYGGPLEALQITGEEIAVLE